MRRKLATFLVAATGIAAFLGTASVVFAAPTSQQPTVSTNNWAGYVVQQPGKKFSAVTGTFTVPYVDACADEKGDGGQVNFLVGLGGYGASQDAEAGVQAACNNAYSGPLGNGFTQYTMVSDFSDAAKIGPIVKEGDVITASVSVTTKGVYQMVVKDVTTHAQFGWSNTCTTCFHGSAEWMATTAPGDNTASQFDLPYFANPGFRAATAKLTGTSVFHPVSWFVQWRAVNLVSQWSGNELAYPGPLQTSRFKLTWLSSET